MAPVPPVNPPDSSDALPPQLPGLDIATALSRLRGRVDSLKKLLAAFAENQAEVVPSIQNEWAAGNHEASKRLAHTLKGLAGTIGAEELQIAAKAVETACGTDPRGGDITDLLATLDVHLRQVMASIATLAIESESAVAPSPDAPALDPQVLATRLDALAEALDDGDPGAGDQLSELLDHDMPDIILSGLREIKQHVTGYAFEEALETLAAMQRKMNEEKEDADV